MCAVVCGPSVVPRSSWGSLSKQGSSHPAGTGWGGLGALVDAALSAVNHNDPNIEYYYFQGNLCVKSHPNVVLKTAQWPAAIVGVFDT